MIDHCWTCYYQLLSQCEMVRIYLTAVPTVHSCHFCHFSLIFPILSIPGHVWFSNLTYFAHFALNITPLFSQYIQDTCQSSIQTSSFYSSSILPGTTCCAIVPFSMGAPTVLCSSAIRSFHEYLVISCCFLVFT